VWSHWRNRPVPEWGVPATPGTGRDWWRATSGFGFRGACETVRRLLLLLDDRFATSASRRLAMAAAVLVVAVGALIAALLTESQRPGPTGLRGPMAGTSAPSALPRSSDRPAGEAAGSRRMVVDFDTLATNSRIDGWTLTDGARLRSAVLPTAVDRSARLHDGTACHELQLDVAELEATFMLARLPEGEVAALVLELRDGSTHRVMISDEQVTLVPGGEPVPIEAGRWYRWRLAIADVGVRAEVLAVDGTTLSQATSGPGPDPRATDFCMTVAPAAALHLSDLAVGTP
jgi:hypothetical protein